MGVSRLIKMRMRLQNRTMGLTRTKVKNAKWTSRRIKTRPRASPSRNSSRPTTAPSVKRRSLPDTSSPRTLFKFTADVILPLVPDPLNVQFAQRDSLTATNSSFTWEDTLRGRRGQLISVRSSTFSSAVIKTVNGGSRLFPISNDTPRPVTAPSSWKRKQRRVLVLKLSSNVKIKIVDWISHEFQRWIDILKNASILNPSPQMIPRPRIPSFDSVPVTPSRTTHNRNPKPRLLITTMGMRTHHLTHGSFL